MLGPRRARCSNGHASGRKGWSGRNTKTRHGFATTAAKDASNMLTGNLVVVRYARDRIRPVYLSATDAAWQLAAERLLDIYRSAEGRSRGELDEELREIIGNDPAQRIHLGLAKLLEDRCEFEVVAGVAP